MFLFLKRSAHCCLQFDSCLPILLWPNCIGLSKFYHDVTNTGDKGEDSETCPSLLTPVHVSVCSTEGSADTADNEKITFIRSEILLKVWKL